MARKIGARLHVLLAREARNAVVVRRGPSRHTAVVGWDRDTDSFQVGQWLHGRIYERRCDLSPDGRHLLYFAMNGRWSSATRGSWSAISRAPYLRALTLWAKGDCWHGGGLFLSSREYWLNGCGHELQRDESGLIRSTAYPWHESYGGECPSVYYIRLQRDGWAMQHTRPDGSGGEVSVFEKRVHPRWKLRKLAHATLHHPVGRGVYFDTHELLNTRSAEVIPCTHWEWADIDGDRLAWAADGKLYAGRLGAQGVCETTLLYDFNTLLFQNLPAPY